MEEIEEKLKKLPEQKKLEGSPFLQKTLCEERGKRFEAKDPRVIRKESYK